MNDDENTVSNNQIISEDATGMPSRYVSMKRYYKFSSDQIVERKPFFSFDNLGSCVFCKISIALLILLSFIVVRPAQNQQVNADEELKTVQVSPDTLKHSAMINHR